MTKAILFTLLAACGAHANTTDPVEERPRTSPDHVDEPEDQHFCCDSVDLDKWTGDNCVAISEENINTCAEVLYCPALWGKSGGTTKCAS